LLPFTQTKSQTLCENDSIYLKSIEKYVVEIDSFYLKYSNYDKDIFNNLYFEQSHLFDKLPDTIDGHKIILLNSSDLVELYHRNGNRLIYNIIKPTFEKGILRVMIIPYIGELDESGNFLLGLSDWTNVFFEFDCVKKRWKYFKTENGGI